GHSVVAVDRDVSGLCDLEGRAGVEIIEADLEGENPWPLRGRLFAGIAVVNYLHRPLFPRLLESLAPGGALIYETFGRGHERFGRPNNPDFLLREGELLEVVRGQLDVVAFEQTVTEDPRPALVQRIAAIG